MQAATHSSSISALPTSNALRRRAAARWLVHALQIAATLFGVLTICFFLTHVIPGNPARLILGELATEDQLRELTHELGFDQPLVVQYGRYLGGLLHGDLGQSLQSGRPVIDEIAERAGATLLLIGLGTATALVWGVGLGIGLAGGRTIRPIADVVVSLGMAVPDFVVGIVAILVFYFVLRWAPAPVGQMGLFAAPVPVVTGAAVLDALVAGDWAASRDALAHLVLPVLTLAFVYGAPIARVTAGRLRESAALPYVDYARLTGIAPRRVFAYRMRGVWPAVITSGAITLGRLLSGAVLVETVFNWGGLSMYAARAILSTDFPAIQGFTLLASIFSLSIYLALEALYRALDPRVSA